MGIPAQSRLLFASLGLVVVLLLSGCQDDKPGPEPQVDCDPSWTIGITPETRFHTEAFSAAVSTNAPVGTEMEYAIGVSSDGGRAWRPLESIIPVPAQEGEVEVVARFTCDVPGTFRASMTYIFPDADALVYVTPDSGDYRNFVTAEIEPFPADLTWEVSLFSAQGTAVTIPNNNIVIPADGKAYTLHVQGWDRHGHPVTPIERTYSSDPYSPAILSILPSPGPMRPDDVFYVSFDKPLDIAASMQNNDVAIVQYISEYQVRVFPRHAWEPGILDIPLDDFRFQGKHGSSLLHGEYTFPLLYDVCPCTGTQNVLLGMQPFDTVLIAEFPRTITLASLYAINASSIHGRLVSLFDGARTYFDKDDFTFVDAQQYALNLVPEFFQPGGVYMLQVTSNTTHPLSPASTAYLQFSVAATGYVDALTEVTAAENFFIYNHPINYANTLTEKTGYSLTPGPNPFTLQYDADAVTGYSFGTTDLAGASYAGTGTSAATGPQYPDLVTYATLFPADTTLAVPDWGQAQWILRTPKPVTYITPSHMSVTFDTGATFFPIDVFARNTHEVVFAVRDFLDLYTANSARAVLMFTVWFKDGSQQDFLHRVDLVQGEDTLQPQINLDSIRANFFSSSNTQASLQSLSFNVGGLTADTAVTAYIETFADQVTLPLTKSGSNRYALPTPVGLDATDALAEIVLYARGGTGALLDSYALTLPIAASIGFASATTLHADSATEDTKLVQLTGNPVTTAGSSLLISRLYDANGAEVQNWFWPAFVDTIPLFTGHLAPGLYSLHVDLLTGSDPGYQRTGYSSAQINLQID